MVEEVLIRRVTGIVVAATTLIMILLTALTFQVVTLIVQHNRLNALYAEQARLEQNIDDTEKTVEYYESKQGLEDLAWQQGFVHSNGR